MNKYREPGYYWVKTKRTKIWMIAKWWPALNKGKGFWDTMATIENDTRGGFIEVDENRIVRPIAVPEKIKRVRTVKVKRTRKNDKETNHKKLSEPQKHRTRLR
jgi:hypothetical protein